MKTNNHVIMKTNHALCGLLSGIALAATFAGVIVSGALAGTVAPAPGDANFSDGTFLDSDWTSAKIYDSTPNQNGTFITSQETSGGNPGAYQRTNITFSYLGNGIEVQVFIAHLQNAAIYNPSTEGAIASINFSMDSILISPGSPDPFGDLLLSQGGVDYQGPGFDISNHSWGNTAFTGLTASNFFRIGSIGPSSPDFSDLGAPIQFGYLTETGAASGPAQTFIVESGIDNWDVSVFPVPVPEPGSVTLAVLGGLALLARRKSFRSHLLEVQGAASDGR